MRAPECRNYQSREKRSKRARIADARALENRAALVASCDCDRFAGIGIDHCWTKSVAMTISYGDYQHGGVVR
jgi:hypothetical protein